MLIACKRSSSKIEWPEITQETKPWTRWWWMGNIVNKEDLKNTLKEYQKAGLGGVEITPIYGIKGYEEKFINYLSPEWINLFTYTLEEAKKLSLGVDIATGTGWPFGGPWVNADDACKYIAFKIYTLKKDEKLDELIHYLQDPLIRAVGHKVDITELLEPISSNKNLQELALDQVRFEKQLPLVALMAYSDNGNVLDLTEQVDSVGNLNWIAKDGNWKLYALFQGWHGKMVERAAPGGETNVIDHFSEKALNNYLEQFDKAFEGKNIQSLRAFFNDSYEVDDAYGQANWTPLFLNEFKIRRGYDLRYHLPALFGQDSIEKNIRVLCDYRETISELLLEEFTIQWNKWAKNKKAITRNQAHGSPANILDLYAACDIPETEGNDILRFKFASSAANVTGKRLISSESATWLNEHFQTTLNSVKNAIDHYFLGGINHIFYHGTTFSPADEKWPGWMFYASVHFGPTNTFWNDFSALNKYISHCQSFLQAGKPNNEILLYFSFYDRISTPGKEMLEHFSGKGKQFENSDFAQTAKLLIQKGYSLDYISDAQIKNLSVINGKIHSYKINYKTIIIPPCKYMPVETFEKLIDLAQNGATIIVYKNLPPDIPGFGQLEERKNKFQNLLTQLNFTRIDNSEITKATVGNGAILLGNHIEEMLSYSGIYRESMVDTGLLFIRKNYGLNKIYFIVNSSEKAIDGWIRIQTKAKSIALFNPVSEVVGKAESRVLNNNQEVYLQLQPGESCILKTFNKSINISPYPYIKIKGDQQVINGEWNINFIKGGPTLPGEIKTSKLDSWTNLGGDDLKSFSGTAKYSVNFKMPDTNHEKWMLDLGSVHESAVIFINGKQLTTLFSPPFRIIIPPEILKENNLLEIKVTNLMANRIAYLDRKGEHWKKFYNINFPAKERENTGEDGLFDASNWLPQKSGLIDPVSITPVDKLDFIK